MTESQQRWLIRKSQAWIATCLKELNEDRPDMEQSVWYLENALKILKENLLRKEVQG